MPSVSSSGPSDGGYNYYQKSLTDLEEELKAEAQRKDQVREDRAREMEESHKRDLQKRDEDFQRTAEDIRNNAHESVLKDREHSQAEADKWRAQLYDKFGKVGRADAELLQDQLRVLKDQTADDRQHDRTALENQEKIFHERMEEAGKDSNLKTEKAVQRTHQAAAADYSILSEARKKETSQSQEEALIKKNEQNSQHLAELNYQRRLLDNARNEMERSFTHRLNKSEEADHSRFENQERAFKEKAESAARNLRDSHAQETQAIRDQVKERIGNETGYFKGFGDGRAQSIREQENDWRLKQRQLGDSYAAETRHLEQKTREAQDYYSRLAGQAIHDKEARYTDLIGRQNEENRTLIQDVTDAFQNAHDQTKSHNKMDMEKMQTRLEDRMTQANLEKGEALEGQAKTFNESLKNVKQAHDEQLGLIQKEKVANGIDRGPTSMDVTPAAEAALRKTYMKEYEKNLAAEQDRHARQTDSIQTEYAYRLQSAQGKSQTEQTLMARQSASERQQDKTQFLDYVDDKTVENNIKIRNQEDAHNREVDVLSRNNAKLLDRQRREYEEILQAHRYDSSAKIAAARQQGEYNYRTLQREMSIKENEMVRDYTKRLADQKAEYDAKMEEVKLVSDQAVRETEKKTRVALDEQERYHEQRIAQLEASHKERERYITQVYQDDVEKVKRSNALLAQKKS